MGYVVLHLEKAKGTDSAMSSHIERTVKPKNADETKTHLNKELIEFPEGVKNRTQAIQYRLDNAKLKRKIANNQVRAIRILLSGSPEDMKRIEESGRMDEWCKDNLDWLKDTYGKENLVSAVLHLDETTPHIHATVIPIVTGKRRKAKLKEEKQGLTNITNKKKYKTKDPNATRLCVDDVMTRIKLKEYQNTYAEKMQVYGLERGIDGSEARHISQPQYYKELYQKNKTMQEDIALLIQQKEEEQKKLEELKSQVKKQEVVKSAKSAILGIFSNSGKDKLENGEKKFIPTSYIQFLNKKNIPLNLLYDEDVNVTDFISDVSDPESVKKDTSKHILTTKPVEKEETRPRIPMDAAAGSLTCNSKDLI